MASVSFVLDLLVFKFVNSWQNFYATRFMIHVSLFKANSYSHCDGRFLRPKQSARTSNSLPHHPYKTSLFIIRYSIFSVFVFNSFKIIYLHTKISPGFHPDPHFILFLDKKNEARKIKTKRLPTRSTATPA